MAAHLLVRAAPILRHRSPRRVPVVRFSTLDTVLSSFKPKDQTQPPVKKTTTTSGGGGKTETKTTSTPTPDSLYSRWVDNSDYRQWKDSEAEIFRDIEPIVSLTKEILHSGRYYDGQRLSAEDEKVIVEKLLPYHPSSEDKIGCGLDFIMVDRHPEFSQSRCLFVVRADGGWIDFSYHKCLRAYIRDKYPTYGERFVREHFGRGMAKEEAMENQNPRQATTVEMAASKSLLRLLKA